MNSLRRKTKEPSPSLACSNMLPFSPPCEGKKPLKLVCNCLANLWPGGKKSPNPYRMEEITQTRSPPDLTFPIHVVLEDMRSLNIPTAFGRGITVSVEVPTGVGAANSGWPDWVLLLKTCDSPFTRYSKEKKRNYILSRGYL